MFENGQDTNLLRNSMISSSQCLKKHQGTYSLKDEETAVQVVVSTIKTLANNLHGINTFHELFQKQKYINQRCHAVVLINLLKSQNICNPEADNFYQAVFYNVDNITWSYYLQLNFLCNWSEYFIECACQLPTDVLSVVLKKILEVKCEGELQFYAFHLALQTYIRKAFELHSTSIIKPNNEINFTFNFCIPKSLQEECATEDSSFGSLQSIFNIILEQLSSESNKKCDINYIKVMLHGFKTIFKLLNTISFDEEDISCVEKLNLLTPFFKDCLTQEAMESSILQNMEKPFQGLIDYGYQIMSWEINDVYLVFLLHNFWKDLKTKPIASPESKTPLKTSSFCNDFIAYMNQNNLSYTTLVDLNEKYLNISTKTRESYFLLMTVIVKHHYTYASRAAESLLLNPQLWDKYKVIDLLEENVKILDPDELHISLADAIVEPKSKDMHDRLLNIFYKILSQATPEIYNVTLENILKNWGFCEYFKSSNFEAQLTQLSRKTMSLKEVEDTLSPLFVQSPIVVLQFLIEQAMMQGVDGMEALKVLKSIPIACVYVCEEEPSTPPLISILSPYFEHSLRANEAKHFMILLKTLMEIQITEDILSFDVFLDVCILPNSVVQNVNQLEFTLQCLYAALDVLINSHALEISSKKYIMLLKHLGSILGFCIENSLGKLKENVVDIMKLLSEYKKKPQLDDLFKNDDIDSEEQLVNNEDLVRLYFIGIFLKDINTDQKPECYLLEWKNKVIKKNFQHLWIWCCITTNIDDFVDNVSLYKLSFIDLMKYLPSILWHLTRSEWQQSAKIIMYYQHFLKIGASDYPWLLPDNDPELYGVIRCLMDGFTLMMKEKSSKDTVYCSSCLTNTIMGLLDKKTIPPSLLVNVFIDICCVSSYINFEVFFMFSSVLMSLQKQYLSVCSKADQIDGKKLMKLSLDCIENDAVDKECLKDKFCQM